MGFPCRETNVEAQKNGALGEIRTHDLCLRRAALYPLSYKRAMDAAGYGLLVGAEGGI